MPTLTYPSGRKATAQDRADALERLREWLKDGDTLYFILRHRASSGMSRIYDVKQIMAAEWRVENEELVYFRPRVSHLTWNIALACDFAWNESHGGIRINGCGFSGEQEIADTLGRKLGITLRHETL